MKRKELKTDNWKKDIFICHSLPAAGGRASLTSEGSLKYCFIDNYRIRDLPIGTINVMPRKT